MKPYNEEQTKKQQVEEMFDNIAPTYDKLNHIMSLNIDRIWRRRVMRIVRRSKAVKIMDVATGTILFEQNCHEPLASGVRIQM